MARNSYGIAKRSIWYVLRTLIITAAIVALCLGVFIEGLHISNLYILVTEGMEKRTEAILKYGQTGVDIDLTPYFSEEYLNNDHELDSGKYAGFTVASYDYRIDVKAGAGRHKAGQHRRARLYQFPPAIPKTASAACRLRDESCGNTIMLSVPNWFNFQSLCPVLRSVTYC